MMPYEPLHHKYRPQTFADLVGQGAIATTLTNGITSGRIAPAYLFTGPRGTGKTSSARILAKSLNCLQSSHPTPKPCGQCEVCRGITNGSALDVIEIDAASNTGVDNIREIIERAQFAPVQCRYKVYVIDECHMLSVAAFNALLKTLEEPPSRVVFVLATTDPQRVLPTIISRCQRFDYRPIPLQDMVAHLQYIADKESISIDDEAITLIAQIANGGLRDAESLLDQLSLLSGTITSDRVWELVGAVPEKDLLKLLQLIKNNQPEEVIRQSRHLMNRGREPLVVLQNLAGFYLNLLLAKTAPNNNDLIAVTSLTWQELCCEAQRWELSEIFRGQQHLKESENQVKNTTQPRLWLEVTLLGLLPSAMSISVQPIVEQQPPTKPVQPTPPVEIKPQLQNQTPVTPSPKPVGQTQESKRAQEHGGEEEESPPAPLSEGGWIDEKATRKPTPTRAGGNLRQIWQALIKNIQTGTISAFLEQQCHLISFDGTIATIGVHSQALFKYLNESRIAQIREAFKIICDHPIQVNIRIAKKGESTDNQQLKTPEPHIPSQSSNGFNKARAEHPSHHLNKEDWESNGHQPDVQEEESPPAPLSEGGGIIESKPKTPIDSSPNNLHNTFVESTAEQIPTENRENTTDYSAEELFKIAQEFSKTFDGEILPDNDNIGYLNQTQEISEVSEQSSDTQQQTTQQRSEEKINKNEEKKQNFLDISKKSLKNKPKITGRPDRENIAEEDLDF